MCFYRLKELLRTRLIECGWRDQLKAHCKDIVKKKGLECVTVDDLVTQITPKGRALVPDDVKRELLQRIRTFLAQQWTETPSRWKVITFASKTINISSSCWFWDIPEEQNKSKNFWTTLSSDFQLCYIMRETLKTCCLLFFQIQIYLFLLLWAIFFHFHLLTLPHPKCISTNNKFIFNLNF